MEIAQLFLGNRSRLASLASEHSIMSLIRLLILNSTISQTSQFVYPFVATIFEASLMEVFNHSFISLVFS